VTPLRQEQWAELRQSVTDDDRERFERLVEIVLNARDRERKREHARAEQARSRALGRNRPWIPQER
jgi:hypothetical protein